MGVIEGIQIALSLVTCAAVVVVVIELRRSRRAEERDAAALRDAIARMDERQLAHRDALVGRVSEVLHHVMNDTTPRTVVIGPQETAQDTGERPRPNLRVVPPPDEPPPAKK